MAGVRVRVVPAPTPWPRTGGVLAVGELGQIGRLAVLTAVPRSVGGWTELAERTLGGRRTPAPAAAPADVLLPVAVRHRYGADDWLAEDDVPRDLAAAVGLVVEVHLLPPLFPGGRLTSAHGGLPHSPRHWHPHRRIPGASRGGHMPEASWLPDPSGGHELRYWNGATWTEHVSDQGTTAVEPPPPGLPAPPDAAPPPPPAPGWGAPG